MRLIGVLDHQIVESELRLDRAKQRRLWLVKTEPNDPTVAARKGADLFDRDIAHPLAVAVKRAGDYPDREISAATAVGRSSTSVRDPQPMAVPVVPVQRAAPAGKARVGHEVDMRAQRLFPWNRPFP